MKLSIMQIVLGVIIILAACYITGWMIHQAPDQLRHPWHDNDGTTDWVDVVPEHEFLFNTARYGSYLLPFLGIFIVIINTIQATKGGTNIGGFALAGIIAGVMTAGIGFIIIGWGYPTTFNAVTPEGVVVPEGTEILKKIFTNPGRSHIAVQSATGLLLLIGLAVSGIGIAQLVKSKKNAALQ